MKEKESIPKFIKTIDTKVGDSVIKQDDKSSEGYEKGRISHIFDRGYFLVDSSTERT